MVKSKKFEIVITEETKKYLKEKGYKTTEGKTLEELIEEEKKKLENLKDEMSKKLEKSMTTNISWLQNIHEAQYYYNELKDLAKELHDTIREVYSYDDVIEVVNKIDEIFDSKPHGTLFEMYIGVLLIMRAIKTFYPKVDKDIAITNVESDNSKIIEIKKDLNEAIEKGDMELVEYIIEELKAIVGEFRDHRKKTVQELITTMVKAKQKKLNSF